MQPFLIDADAGTDDAIALLMALNAPEVDVLGVTTSGGNASLSHTTRNTLAVLEHMGRASVPVARGFDHALAGGQFHHGYDFHGHRGIGVHMPRATIAPIQQDAPTFMANALAASPSPVAFVALAPLTSIAHLLQRHPAAARNISRLVFSSGALETGDMTPYANFNSRNDPEAAAIVFSSGVPITLAPLEACAQVTLSLKDLAHWRDADAPGARLADRILYKWFQRQPSQRLYIPCDLLTMAIALSPSIATYLTGAAAIDADEGETRGRIRFQPGSGPVTVANNVDITAFHRLLDALLLKSNPKR